MPSGSCRLDAESRGASLALAPPTSCVCGEAYRTLRTPILATQRGQRISPPRDLERRPKDIPTSRPRDVQALPCAAAHAFHSDCVRGALAASVHCPLCRVDVRSLVLSPAAPSDGPAPASPRSLGLSRTRAGLRCLCARSFVTTRGYEQASRATAASFSGTWPRLRDRKKNTRAESPRAGNVRSRGTPGSHSAPSSLEKSVLTSHTHAYFGLGDARRPRAVALAWLPSHPSRGGVCVRDHASVTAAP